MQKALVDLSSDCSAELTALVFSEADESMLSAAVCSGNEAVVKCLLQKGSFSAVLSELALKASANGHLPVLLALEQEAEWKAESSFWANVLIAACKSGHASIAAHALEKCPSLLVEDEVIQRGNICTF
jgi:hypothetical protein